ncbi:MAG: VOC family protein [bacterium]|nr:VOC family protein [bacterium]
MIRGLESVTLFSESAKDLAAFYREKVGLKTGIEAEMGEAGEEMYELVLGDGPNLYVVDHSVVKGKNKEPERIIFNLEVDNIEDEVKRLDEAGIKKIADTYHVEGYGYIATFEDLDGNYFQLAQVKA